jgi:hypothetical protein
MTFTLVNDNSGSGFATSINVALTAVSLDDLIVAGAMIPGADVLIDITDDINTGAYTEATKGDNGVSDFAYIHYFPQSVAGTPTVTMSISGGNRTIRMTAAAYNGEPGAKLDRARAAESGSGAAIDSGDVSIRAADELLVGVATTDAGRTLTAGTGYTVRNTGANQHYEDDLNTKAVGVYDADGNIGTSSPWTTLIATFSESVPPEGAGASPRILLHRVTRMGHSKHYG